MPVAVRKAEHAAWETVEMTHRDGSTATVQGLGAQVTSWCDATNGEQLFVSRLSPWQVGEPIVGGIAVCFPSFTSEEEVGHTRTYNGRDRRSLEPTLGFARTMVWQVVHSEQDDRRDPWVVMRVQDDHETTVRWPHAFCLELRVTLASAALDVELAVRNTAAAPLYSAPTSSPVYGSRAFSFQAALKNWLVVTPTAENTSHGGQNDSVHHRRAKPGTPFSIPGSQRPRSVDQRAAFLGAALDATNATDVYDAAFSEHAATGEKLLPAEEAAAAAAEDDIDPARIAEIRKKKASELTKEEMELDARARVRRRHKHLAAASKARQRSTAKGLKHAQDTLNQTVLGAMVSGLHGCNYADLDKALVQEGKKRKLERRRKRRESGMSDADADAAEQREEWEQDAAERRGELTADSHGIARVYLGVPMCRSVAVRCAQRRYVLARDGFSDLGVSNWCGTCHSRRPRQLLVSFATCHNFFGLFG
eukprot:COSAG02_NODE_1103_length_14561_cov_2.692435_1_plen_477_part_00